MEHINEELINLIIKLCQNNDSISVKKFLNRNNIDKDKIYKLIQFFIDHRNFTILEYLIKCGLDTNIAFDGQGVGMSQYAIPPRKPITKTYHLHYAIDFETENYVFNSSSSLTDEEISNTIPTLIIESLIRSGNNINLRNEKGDTPLDISVDKYNKSAEQLIRNSGGKTSEEILLEYIKDKDKKDKYINFIYACEEGNIELVKSYLDKEIINGFPQFPMSNPLMRAIHYQRYDVLKYILEQGADTNLLFNGGGIGKNNQYLEHKILNGTYSIHCAIEQESLISLNESKKTSISSIELLINYGANLNLRNENGDTPLDIAYYRNNNTIKILLRSLGAKTSKELEEENNKSSS